MIVLITGGVKSGKSSFALSLAEKLGKKRNLYFLATALPRDSELKERIKEHRRKRGKFWKTVEESENIDKIFLTIPQRSTVLVDCFTLWLGNLLSKRGNRKTSFRSIKKTIGKMISSIREKRITTIFVTNEVGWGIVPENKLGRVFEDFLGRLNQILTKFADEVYLMIGGIGIKIKSQGGGNELERMFGKD